MKEEGGADADRKREDREIAGRWVAEGGRGQKGTHIISQPAPPSAYVKTASSPPSLLLAPLHLSSSEVPPAFYRSSCSVSGHVCSPACMFGHTTMIACVQSACMCDGREHGRGGANADRRCTRSCLSVKCVFLLIWESADSFCPSAVHSNRYFKSILSQKHVYSVKYNKRHRLAL